MAAIDMLDAFFDRHPPGRSLWRIDRTFPPDPDRLAASVTCGCGATFARYRFAAATLAAGGDAVTGFAAETRAACPDCGAEIQSSSSSDGK